MTPSRKANVREQGISFSTDTRKYPTKETRTWRAGRGLIAPAAAVATVAMLVAPTTAGAEPLSRTTATYYSISCMALVGPAGTAQLAVDDEAASTARYAPGTDPSDEGARPEIVSSSAAYVLEGDTVTGSFELVDFETGEPAGQASFEAQLAPDGEASTTTARGRRGNVVFRDTFTTQPLRVSGMLEFSDGARYSLADCTGERKEVRLVENVPHAFTERFDPQTVALCEVTDEDGYTLAVLLEGHDALDSADVALFEPHANEPSLFGWGEVTGTTRTVTGEVALIDRDGGVAGSATIAGDIDASAPSHSRYEIDGARYRLETRDLALSGTVTVPGRPAFSLDGCTGVAQRGSVLVTDPNRPEQTGGKS
ncbi:MAG TPA: hypothetical protein VGV93_14140 [Acidimicrobiales bacterium]|nr:hypothetical protein [Acidimicrobiales bacterium]